MSERGCIKCGHTLAGLPATGTVVSCPECGQANDLAIPMPARVKLAPPFLWAMIPVALSSLLLKASVFLSNGVALRTTVLFVTAGVLGGAITAGVLMYRVTEREPKLRGAPRPHGGRLVLTVSAFVLSMAFNAIAMFVVLCLLFSNERL